MKIVKTIWKILEKFIIAAIILISIIIVTQRVSNNKNAFLGFRIFRVETGSMIPKYQIGDVILVKETNIDKIEIGDDVTYNGTAGMMKGKVVTHQVIEITENEILGKTIKIRHENDLISTYQSLSEININQDDVVMQGQVIGKSGTCSIYKDNHNLHFELYYQGKNVNPEEYYNKTQDEL